MKLKIEHDKIKLEQMGVVEVLNQPTARDAGRVGHYAKELRGVLALMLASDALVPAWFKKTETMMASCQVPEEQRCFN